MKKKWIAGLLAAGLCLVLTGCSTSLMENTEIYFSQVKQKLELIESNKDVDLTATPEPSQGGRADDGKTALAAPGGWSVDAQGNYTFDAVDGADYYIIYLYDTLAESTSFSYMSDNLVEDGSGAYSGKLSDLFGYCYGLYNAEVVAYPAVGAKDIKRSEAAACDFSVTGEVPEARLGYLWDCFTGTLGVELLNFEEYGASSFPTAVEVIFTNRSDSSDVITLTFENVSIENDVFSASTQDVSKDVIYDVSASLTWNDQVVTNASMQLDLGSVETASNKNAMTEGYGYLNNTIYQSMDYPMVVTDFDPAAGGSAGTWQYFITAFTTNKGVAIPTTFIDCLNFQGEKGSMGAEYHDGENVEFTVTPTAVSAGSAYSYTLSVQGPRGVVSLFDGFFFNDMPAGTGTLELLTDGTLVMTIDPPAAAGESAGPMGPRGLSGSTISGLWVENGDGTLTLSYDHTSAALT